MQSIFQRVTEDWTTRESIEAMTRQLQALTDFLNKFENVAKEKLAVLTLRVRALERRAFYVQKRRATLR